VFDLSFELSDCDATITPTRRGKRVGGDFNAAL